MEIPLFKIYRDEQDGQAVKNAIASDHWTQGQSIIDFETQLGAYTEFPGVLTFNSGTSALHAALLACNIRKDDRVIVPSFTFIASANVVLMTGGIPVFADIEPMTFGLNPKDVAERITKKVKAIIAVHYGGCACQIRELRRIAETYRIHLIEDCCEALGAKVGDLHVGHWGSCGVLSFCANKIITTGEGGAMLTDDKRIYGGAALIRSHGRNGSLNDADGDYVRLGYNYRMSDITAALGSSQLAKLDRIIAMRQWVARRYSERLTDVEGITLPVVPERQNHTYMLYSVLVKNGRRDALQAHLTGKGIHTKVYFQPVHQTKFYRRLGYKDKLPVTERIASEVLSLPMYPTLTAEEIDYICQEIKEGLNEGKTNSTEAK